MVDMAARLELLAHALQARPADIQVVQDAAATVAGLTGAKQHDALVVLGSGSADALASWGEPVACFPLSQLPGVCAPVADGHRDEVRSYERESKRVLVYVGRTHLYEGRGVRAVVHPVQLAAMCGVERAVLTNANGCLRDWELGDVVTLTDHINLSGASPFDGTVFTDVSGVWDAGLAAATAPLTQRQGVYALLRGPEYQTQAESRLLAGLGADVVGMSTVLEAIALHQLGVRVAGLSVVSDLSFAAAPTDPQAVVDAAAGAAATVAAAVSAVLRAS